MCLCNSVAQTFCFDSPPRDKIRFPDQETPPSTRLYDSPDSVGETMPPTASPDVSTEQLYNFFLKALSAETLDMAESKGVLFPYALSKDVPSKKDTAVLKTFHKLMKAHMTEHKRGCFVKSRVHEALKDFERHTGRNISKKIDLRLQSGNHVRYYHDVRRIKGSMTTGAKLEPHILELCKIMEPLSAIDFFNIARSVCHCRFNAKLQVMSK